MSDFNSSNFGDDSTVVTNSNTQNNDQKVMTPTHTPPEEYPDELVNHRPEENTNTNTNTDNNNNNTNANTNTDTNTGQNQDAIIDTNAGPSPGSGQNDKTTSGGKGPSSVDSISKQSNKPSSDNNGKIGSSEENNSPISPIAIGIGSVAVLLIVGVVLFIYLKKRKNNNKNVAQAKSDIEESEYQIGSEFLKTDNNLTLPFADNASVSITSDVISESAFYNRNSALFNNQNNKSEVAIDVPLNRASIDGKVNEPISSTQNQTNDDTSKYCIDMNFETPTLDLAFPKPTLKSSLSSSWFPEDLHESNETTDNKEILDHTKPRYVTNNVINSPEKVLATEEISKFDSIQGFETIGENIRLQTPTPVSKASSSSSLNNKEKSSSDDIVRHSPQTHLTPKKSILKKSGQSRTYNGGTPTRNASVKKTTIGHNTGTLNRNNNSNGSISVDNMGGNKSQSDEEVGTVGTIGRSNTATSTLRLPPAFTAFHHALPTPPTPKSTKFFGPDGELLPGQVVNEELMVPDVLNDAMERHDIHRNQNFPGSYCTIRRKTKNARDNESTSKKQGIDRKNSNHRRNRSQDYTHGSDKLDYYNAKPVSNKKELYNNKENYQYNMPNNSRENFPAKPPRRSNASGLHHSKTLPRNFNSSKKYDYDYNRRIPNKPYNIEEERERLTNARNDYMSNRVKRNSMEAEFLIQNANVSLTCFEEDLLKNSITEKDKLKDINSVVSILREERRLLNQVGLETPK